MLQKIRDNSQGTVAKIIVGLIICTFALFGIESIVSLGAGDDAPATVNGEEISELEVAQRVDVQKRRFQAQFGENFDPSFLNEKLLRDTAVQSLVEEKVMAQAAVDSGVYFSDMAVDRIIVSSPEFQEAGQFSASRFDLILRNAGFTRNTYREWLRNTLMSNQGQAAWQATAFAMPEEALRLSSLNGQSRDFATYELKLEDVKKAVDVSDEEVNEYYEANKNRFMSEETVVVDYIVLSQQQLAAKIDVDEDEVKSRYEALKAEANSKREYRAAHVLILGADQAAKDKAAEALAQVQKTSFDEVVKTYSEDDSSKFSGGDLGFAELSIFEPEFAEALRGLNEGGVSTVVETRDGQHIIKLLETRQPEVAAFEEIKDTIATELKAEQAASLYAERLEMMKDEAFSSERLQPVAQAQGLEIQTTEAFSRKGGSGVAGNRAFVQAAFSENVIYENANSEVIDLGEGRAAVLHVRSHSESAVRPLVEVAQQVKSLVLNDKAKALLAEKAEEALAKAKAGELTGWDIKKGLKRDSKDVSPKVLTKAFALSVAEGQPGFALVDVAAGKVVVRLDSVVQAEATEATAEEVDQVNYRHARNEFGAYRQFKVEAADIDRG